MSNKNKPKIDENSPFRTLAFTEKEIEKLKVLFAGNDIGILAVRNHMLQFELTAEDKSFLSILTDDDVAFLKRMFIPIANRESKFGVISDSMNSLDVSGMDAPKAFLHMKARAKVLAYLRQQLDAIKNPGTKIEITLDGLAAVDNLASNDGDTAYINYEARRTLLTMVDFTLNQLRGFAGENAKETPAQTRDRMNRNSSK